VSGKTLDVDVRLVLARNLKALRQAQKLTQMQLAKKAGLGQGTISRIESGKETAADVETVAQIAEALHCKAWRLLLDEELVILPPHRS